MNKEKIVRVGTWITILSFTVAFWVIVGYYTYHTFRNFIMSN